MDLWSLDDDEDPWEYSCDSCNHVTLPTWYQDQRHKEKIVGIEDDASARKSWLKYRNKKVRTCAVGIVTCLNVGVDPPGIKKPDPCAKLHCWIDPFEFEAQRAVSSISHRLTANYDVLSQRSSKSNVRYKACNDPGTDDVRRLSIALRRCAGEERVLFHYNGHGVPLPSKNGEIWLFNNNFTQYIPFSIFDLQRHIGFPVIYVWECHSAGSIVTSFTRFAEDHVKAWTKNFDEHMEKYQQPLPVIDPTMDVDAKAEAFKFQKRPNFRNCFHLAACEEDEMLPMDPELPADMFTSCLTTPIQMSILWHIFSNKSEDRFPPSNISTLSGDLNDRKTYLGELNWIFTAITDTIAWTSVDSETFQALFRQDLMVAVLFRNFLLAQRLMRKNQCHPVSKPKLPAVFAHPLWNAWDCVLDIFMGQVEEAYLLTQPKIRDAIRELYLMRSEWPYFSLESESSLREIAYASNWFFNYQLKDFEIWLRYGRKDGKPPKLLPVLLQMLLSQTFRLKALELLAQFVDLGTWAVNYALCVGIFPYIDKLLVNPSTEMRSLLAFIWGKILVVEPSCRFELIKEPQSNYKFFINMLKDRNLDPCQKIFPAFVMAIFINNFKAAQQLLTNEQYSSLCLGILDDAISRQCILLRLWIIISLGWLWADCDDARWQAIRQNAYENVMDFLNDDVPEVRAAANFALGCLFNNPSEYDEHAACTQYEVCSALAAKCTYDGSVLVRAELVVALQWIVIDFEDKFSNLLMGLNDNLGLGFFVDKQQTSLRCENESDVITSALVEKSSVSINAADRGTFKKPQLGSRSPCAVPKKSNSVNFVIPINHKSVSNIDNFSSKQPPKCPSTAVFSSVEEDNLRSRILQQIRFIESKTFRNLREGILLDLLRLSLDPMPQISSMAQVLLAHIEKFARVKLEMKRRLSRLEMDHATSKDVSAPTSSVTFTVGSPSGTSPVNSPVVSDSFQNNLASPSSAAQLQQEIRHSKSDILALPAFHQSNSYLPKRNIFKSAVKSTEPLFVKLLPPRAFVSTDFIPWCSSRFAESNRDMFEDTVANDSTSQMSSGVVPSDWALHTAEGLDQIAKLELAALNNSHAYCGKEIFRARKTKQMNSAIVWSLLRPYLYLSDGRFISILKYDSQEIELARQFLAYGDNPFVEDNICDLYVVNGMTHELLMTCSSSSLIRIWDPCYSIHSHEFIDQPQLIAASYLLNDLQRYSSACKTIYRWNQSRGIVLAAGNVGVCRLWDVRTEKVLRDIPITLRAQAKNRSVTCLSTDETCNETIAAGFDDGSIVLLDPRAAPQEQTYISEFNNPVVGLSLVPNLSDTHSSNMHLVAGSSDGKTGLWDPRMFKEPIWFANVFESKKAGTSKIIKIVVQSRAKIFACATKPFSLKFFDTFGKLINEIDNFDSVSNSKIGTPCAISFHETLASVVVTTSERYVSAYGIKILA